MGRIVAALSVANVLKYNAPVVLIPVLGIFAVLTLVGVLRNRRRAQDISIVIELIKEGAEVVSLNNKEILNDWED